MSCEDGDVETGQDMLEDVDIVHMLTMWEVVTPWLWCGGAKQLSGLGTASAWG